MTQEPGRHADDPVVGDQTQQFDPLVGEQTQQFDPLAGDETQRFDPLAGDETQHQPAEVTLHEERATRAPRSTRRDGSASASTSRPTR